MSEPGELLAALASGRGPVDLGEQGIRAMREAVAIGLRPERGAFRVAGSDRHDFLQRMLTASLRPRPDGAGCRSLLLDNKGRIQADLDIHEAGEELLVTAAADAVERTTGGLGRFVLRADVRFVAEPVSVVALVGPDVGRLVGDLGLDLPGGRPGRVAARIGETSVDIVAGSALPQGVEIVMPADRAPSVARALIAAGAVPLGRDGFETLRIEAGVPALDRELADAPFPQEVGLETAVDFDKGCYVGQETVARIHYRGGVKRLLRGLRLERALSAGELASDDRPAGRITSAVESDRLGPIALAMVRSEHAEPGTELEVTATDGEAPSRGRVVELPFG